MAISLWWLPGAGFDPKTMKPIGYPYGSIPRLLLFWMNTEAVRTGKRRLDLGDTFSEFIRELGLDSRGGGPRSDYHRVSEQMKRLFSSAITLQQTGEEPGGDVTRWLDMCVTVAGDLWWSPKHPDQVNLWGRWLDFWQAKVYAAENDTTLTAIVRELLEEKLSREARARAVKA